MLLNIPDLNLLNTLLQSTSLFSLAWDMLGPCASVLSLFLLASIPHFYWLPIPTRNTDNLPAENIKTSHSTFRPFPGSFFAAAPGWCWLNLQFRIWPESIQIRTNCLAKCQRQFHPLNTQHIWAFQICRSNMIQSIPAGVWRDGIAPLDCLITQLPGLVN